MTRSPLRPLVYSCLVILALSFASPAGAADAVPPDKHLEQGRKALERGAFDEAVLSLSEAARLYERARQPADQVAALIPLAPAYSALRQFPHAFKILHAAFQVTVQ